MTKEHYIVYHSAQDMTAWWNLEIAEKLLDSIDINNEFSLVEYLEFFNIHQYFENKVFLPKWSEEDISKYKSISQELFKKTCIFMKTINESNIIDNLHLLDEVYEYQRDFWYLCDKFKVLENIPSSHFIEILWKYPHYIRFLLHYRDIVRKFDNELRVFLLDYSESCELILEHINLDNGAKKLFFPTSLINEDKENILIKYIDGDNEWFGSLDLIQRLPDSEFLRISPKTKLKARQVYERKNQEFFRSSNSVFKYWYQVGLSENQDEPIKIESNSEWLPSITYSVKIFNELDFDKNPLSVFTLLFSYLNDKWLIELISKESEISIMEWLFSHWNRDDYKKSSVFISKEMLSLLNLQILNTYLINFRNLSLEKIINNHICKVLAKIKGLDWIQFELMNYNIPFQDKITSLIPKFDSFIKQYRCFVEEKKIDFDLIDIDSRPVAYDVIPSVLPNKYFYEQENKFGYLKYIFYSDQSWLFYITWFENKYNNFIDLISNESLRLENFRDYQKRELDILIKEDYLYLDENEYLKIKDEFFIYLIWEIYREWVLPYYSYNKEVREKILNLESKWLLYSKSTLLSLQESDYFNYYLNKSKFINWPEIRNKNIHWYRYSDENEACADYMVLLKIIILTLLKIEFDNILN